LIGGLTVGELVCNNMDELGLTNQGVNIMCRNIKTLHNFKPPATEEEIRASSLQFVRKLSGFTKPSKANEPAFNRAVDEVAQAARELLQSLVTNSPPRDRAVEAAKARARSAERYSASAVPTQANR
jgi:hypothetical protein